MKKEKRFCGCHGNGAAFTPVFLRRTRPLLSFRCRGLIQPLFSMPDRSISTARFSIRDT